MASNQYCRSAYLSYSPKTNATCALLPRKRTRPRVICVISTLRPSAPVSSTSCGSSRISHFVLPLVRSTYQGYLSCQLYLMRWSCKHTAVIKGSMQLAQTSVDILVARSQHRKLGRRLLRPFVFLVLRDCRSDYQDAFINVFYSMPQPRAVTAL